ncbi:MAG TPA: response regulator [Anaeromyxobacteraceae bacterium]|nr:response regulator [Anaeromyxobacteraceae bacterium]
MPHLTIQIIDDDPDIRESLSDVLEDAGYRAVTSPNGARALQDLKDGLRPDLIILDLMMPVMDGWSFRRTLLRDPILATIPVLILSAASNLNGVSELKAAGLLRKAVRLDELLASIAKTVNRRAHPGSQRELPR